MMIKNMILPAATRATVQLSRLYLDDLNPRFGKSTEHFKQDEIREKLSAEKNLDELILSFRENGYYDAEPLLVVESKKLKDEYIVIEGNRRLAAIQILSSLPLAKKFGFEEDHANLSPQTLDQLKNQIPVLVYPNREALWSYLGYRHIKGPM